MKVCILTHCFYPSKLRGGPTVSMVNMAQALGARADVSVVTINRDKDGTVYDSVHEGRNRLFGCDVYYLQENKPSAFYAAIAAIKPDVLYISSLFSWEYSVAALLYGKRNHCRTILAPRGELMPSALSMKSAQKKAFLALLKLTGLSKDMELHVTAEAEKRNAQIVFPKAKYWCITNIPQVSETPAERIEKKPGELRILMVGRIHPIKNVHLGIRCLAEIQGSVTLDIYGPAEVEQYAALCREEAAKLPKNICVSFCGTINHDQMSDALMAHHILLSPTQSENFGQAIAEALLTGMPVVISDQTPWRNLEAANAGWDLPLDDLSAFAAAIQQMADMDGEAYRAKCAAARKYVSEKIRLDALIDSYLQMLTER